MIKIWRNRIWAGTQKLADCPLRYKTGVIDLMKQDINDKASTYTVELLKNLVKNGTVTEEEYIQITDTFYTLD